MSDVGKISPQMGSGPSRAKKKDNPDSKAFRDAMKVGKVKETDPEEKRKRKRQHETEEENSALQGRAPLQREVPCDSNSPFAIRSTSTSRLEGSSSPKGMGSEEDPPASSALATPQENSPSHTNEQMISPQNRDGPPRENQWEPMAPPPSQTTRSPTTINPIEIDLSSPSSLQDRLPSAPSPDQKEGEQLGVVETLVSLPEGSWEMGHKLEQQTLREDLVEGNPLPSSPISSPQLPSTSTPSFGAALSRLSPQVLELFDRMVGSMSVIHESGITETIIHLDNPQFSKSPFFGSQIVIREFSTAPKVYNIELLGNSQATQLFSENAQELVAAFQAGNYNFRLGRVESSYSVGIEKTESKTIRPVKRKQTGRG